MKTANISLQEIFNEIPLEKREETRLSFAISNRLDALMREKGLNKKGQRIIPVGGGNVKRIVLPV